jgi:hypothetical protein
MGVVLTPGRTTPIKVSSPGNPEGQRARGPHQTTKDKASISILSDTGSSETITDPQREKSNSPITFVKVGRTKARGT